MDPSPIKLRINRKQIKAVKLGRDFGYHSPKSKMPFLHLLIDIRQVAG
jgi:hypothetical protein